MLTKHSSAFDPAALAEFVSSRLAAIANPAEAVAMAAYLKTDMPFYGVKTGPKRAIIKEAVRRFPVNSQQEYEAAVMALWRLPHREAKSGAIEVAWGHRRFITVEAIPLYERLIVEGAWWDLVDGVAPYLVGPLLVRWPEQVRPVLDRWVAHDDVWLRRSALICQYRLKEKTDTELLLRYCRLRMADPEFWVRKAIGWALRVHAKVEPGAVRDFVVEHKEELSPLSYKEAARGLAKAGITLPLGDARG